MANGRHTMCARRAMASAVGALLLAPSVWAQAPEGPAPASPQPTTGAVVFAAPGAVLPFWPPDVGTAADPAEERWRFSWSGRPGLRYGDRFALDVKLILQADVRQSSLDLGPRGGTSTWDVRRAGIKGTVLRVLEYEVAHDLNPGGKWRDVYLNVRPAAFAQVQIGRFKIPFGYERLTGPADLDFVNRTRASDALTPGRDVGVMVHGRPFKRVHPLPGRRTSGMTATDPPNLDPAPSTASRRAALRRQAPDVGWPDDLRSAAPGIGARPV